jgi:hypothetical protein
VLGGVWVRNPTPSTPPVRGPASLYTSQRYAVTHSERTRADLPTRRATTRVSRVISGAATHRWGTVRGMRSRQLVAFNTIHDDDVARRFGFSGGLVPGVDVYAYLTWGPVSAWGLDWLRAGAMHARFRLPAYDGESVTVEFDDDGACRLRNQGGVAVAEGSATRPEAPGASPAPTDPDRHPWAPLPAERPPASPDSLREGTVLGSWDVGFHADRAEEYLDDVREELAVYRQEAIAHPGWVLRLANTLLASNVVLGPWIHVGSRVTNHDLIRDGSRVSCRGRVVGEYEHKGHRFVELDVAVLADERTAATIEHTAIYLPRQVRAQG